MRVAQALQWARQAGVARLDAQILLARRLKQSRTWLVTHDEEDLDSEASEQFAVDVARRANGEPLAYIVGEREFHGLTFVVTPAVLVPRPETELLVDWALELLDAPAMPSAPAVVDLGTGSGAVALSIRHGCARSAVTATDVDPQALEVAHRNKTRLELDIELSLGDWWASVGDRRFDLAVSNPPYIAGDDPHLPALSHEPTTALTPGGDGLGALRCLIDGAPAHLRPGAHLLLEHGFDQAPAVQAMFAARGFSQISTRVDLAGHARCTGAAFWH